MMRISTAEFLKNFLRYEHVAGSESVVITRNGRDRAVLLSVEEYRRLKKLDRRNADSHEITQEDIAAMERGKPKNVPARAREQELAYSPLGLLAGPRDEG